MSAPGKGQAGCAARAHRPRWLVRVLLAAALAAGCDVPFEPFQKNTVGPFSVFGYLDLKADTQWIRVMPIRHGLLSDPAPIDAVVTLEHLESGRVVTLRDSLFTFTDPRLDALGYAHNFWTTEPLQPEATYRLRAVRSDGAETTALVEMPPDLEVTLRFFQNTDNPRIWVPRQMMVQAEHLLYTDLIFTVRDASVDRSAEPVRMRQQPATTASGSWGYVLPPLGAFSGVVMPPLFEVGRREARIAVVGSDWPYEPGLSPADVTIPGAIPSAVENGVGSVSGVATWAIPLPVCVLLEAKPDGSQPCTTVLDASSASVVGRVERDPCTDPRELPTVRLTERYADGGSVVWTWKADWDGAYHFEGVRPGSALTLEFDDPSAGAMHPPALGPGERYVAPDVNVRIGCISDGPATYAV